MNIVHCVFSFKTGGAEMLTVDLVNEMCVEHNVTLIIVNNQWSEKLIKQIDKKVSLYFIERKEGSRNPLPILKLNLLLYKIKPHIIHCHDSGMGRILKVKGAKLVYTVHTEGVPVEFYGHYNQIVAISDAVHNDVAVRYPACIKTIYNGISNELFESRGKYNLHEDEPIKLIQVSRLAHEVKGQDVLLHALANLKEEFNANFTFDIVGTGSSLAFLKELVNQLGLEDNVNFRGEIERSWLHSNLQYYHVLVQPSRHEGFGLTILEGFAAGLPVLASSASGPKEIISKTSKGFLFENGDIQSCASQLKLIFTMYRNDQINNYMSRGENSTWTKYSIKSCADRYLHEYSLLSSGR